MTSTITVKNIGPVTDFSTELTKGGGLHVLDGPNGCGKTTILRTIEVLSTGNGKLDKKDGAKQGEASGFGRVLKVKKRTTHTGDIEVEGLDLDIATLHTPPRKTAAGRDAVRIQSLVMLTGCEPSIDLFYPLAESREAFDEIVDESARTSTDLVSMSGIVKRSFEGRGREFEKQAETASANYRTKMDMVGETDLDAPHDAAELAESLRLAIESNAETRRAIQERDEQAARVDGMVAKLKAAQENYQGDSSDDASKNLASLRKDRMRLDTKHAELTDLLEECELEHSASIRREDEASRLLEAASAHAATVREMTQIIEDCGKASKAGPTAEDLADALEAVIVAQKASELGTETRLAIMAKLEAQSFEKTSLENKQLAKKYRDAAAGAVEVLAEAVSAIKGCPLRIKCDEDGDTRLVLTTERNPDDYFDERSDGERWSTIVPLALSDNRVVVLPQAAYGELQPKARKLLDELAKSAGGWIVTAVATDGELSGGAYESEVVS
jgi:hypothetical protein